VDQHQTPLLSAQASQRRASFRSSEVGFYFIEEFRSPYNNMFSQMFVRHPQILNLDLTIRLAGKYELFERNFQWYLFFKK
jgi:hypothetical protein